MSYLVLARKYRPGTFDEVVGQPATARTLRNAIRLGRVAHAYLFAGPRGVGKTSMARILAKALCCEQGPTAEPCGACERCLAIQRGNDLDVVEIDAASNRGIDDIRSLREKARVSPMRGRQKLYIIDEVHQLTSEAFNALLKILEEPPGHVLFVLATTEPERVPDTIRSRCQFFEFRRVSDADIAARLRMVCEAEGIEAEEKALASIARSARGGVRDSQSLLDQAITHGDGKVTLEGVLEVTGCLSLDTVHGLLRSAVDGDLKAVLGEVDRLCRAGIAPEAMVSALLAEVRELLVACASSSSVELLEGGSGSEALLELSRRLDVDRVLVMTSLLLEARHKLRQQDEPRLPLEAALIRIARTPESVPLKELMAALRAAPAPMETARAGAGPSSAAAAPEARAQAVAAGSEGPPAVRDPAELLERVVAEIGKSQGSVAGFLRSFEAVSFDGSVLVLNRKEQGSTLFSLEDKKVRQAVELAGSQILSQPISLKLASAKVQEDARPQAGKKTIADRARDMFDGEEIE